MKKVKKSILILFLTLFLILPVPVTADENTPEEDVFVTLGGEPFGIKMYTDGVYIIRTEEFENLKGNLCCPADESGVKPNDVIKKVNDTVIKTNNDIGNIIEKSEGKAIKIEIERSSEVLTMYLKPELSSEGKYRTGMWIKDSAAGLGTISFYSQELNGFCGLGHGMIDSETNELIPTSQGEANFASVTTVTKSSNGNVGTLNGYFHEEQIGEFNYNNESGIYGKTTSKNLKKELIQIAAKNEVKRGNAKLYTTIEGQNPKYYDIEIIMVRKSENKTNLVIKITDPELLEKTGGIVQGMSGSPIIQNEKLVGVLTHVIVNNVNYGYGIFAETMYEQLEDAC